MNKKISLIGTLWSIALIASLIPSVISSSLELHSFKWQLAAITIATTTLICFLKVIATKEVDLNTSLFTAASCSVILASFENKYGITLHPFLDGEVATLYTSTLLIAGVAISGICQYKRFTQ